MEPGLSHRNLCPVASAAGAHGDRRGQGAAECPPSSSQPIGWDLQCWRCCGPGISPSLGQVLLGLPNPAFSRHEQSCLPCGFWSGEAGECNLHQPGACHGFGWLSLCQERCFTVHIPLAVSTRCSLRTPVGCFPQVDPVSSRLSDIVILEYCWLLLLLMLVKLVWTGQMIFWCMSRGNANESPTGHLISRHDPHASLPFSQETRPQVLGSLHHQSVSKGGSRAGTQGFPPEQHPLPAGKGSHILQLPWSWEQEGLLGCPLSFMRNIWVSSLPGAMGGMDSRSSLMLQQGGSLAALSILQVISWWLCVVTVSLRHCGDGQGSGDPEQLLVALGTLGHSPSKEVPFCRNEGLPNSKSM